MWIKYTRPDQEPSMKRSAKKQMWMGYDGPRSNCTETPNDWTHQDSPMLGGKWWSSCSVVILQYPPHSIFPIWLLILPYFSWLKANFCCLNEWKKKLQPQTLVFSPWSSFKKKLHVRTGMINEVFLPGPDVDAIKDPWQNDEPQQQFGSGGGQLLKDLGWPNIAGM